jgi:lipase maturation factor 1
MHSFINPEATFFVAQWVFIKLLGLTYFIAFGSLLLQVKGLYGSNGIIPLTEIFKGIKRAKNYLHYYYTPSIFWISTSDKMLVGTAVAGMLISLLVLAGLSVSFSLFILYFLYLSFTTVCIYFLSFQWDILLLEVGFAGFLFSLQTPPLPITVFLMWVILFRFMFSSGIVKFLLGSQEWRNLTAMDYHYETQPIANRWAYYFHHQSKAFSKFSTVMIFFSEIILPFFIFTTAELRLFACIFMVLFQILIMFTGNFAFFNILTIALCFTLVDDSFVPALKNVLAPVVATPDLATAFFVSITSMLLIVLNFMQLVDLFKPLPFIERILRIIQPFYLVNRYGLFSYMTTRRFEIIVEGSLDGEHWQAYEFKWKPGDLKIPPRQVAPHQPRLDWQMWFAALGQSRQNPWFMYFMFRLLEDSPYVLKLLKHNPFADAPPKYVRALLYEYHFSTAEEKKMSGEWWKRKYLGLYLPPVDRRW